MTELSVVTPCHDSGDVLGDSIASVVRQSKAAEHLIVSGDPEGSLSDLLSRTGSDARVIYEKPSGIYPAINSGIQAATGEVIGILHADDLYPSDDVLERVAAIFADPAIGACYGDLCYVDAQDIRRITRYWRAGAFRSQRFRHGWMPPHPTFFLRRGIYEQRGLYRTDLGTAADYELMLRMLYRHRVGVAYLPQVLVHMRGGGASNATWGARLTANRMDREAWRVNGLIPYPWTLAAKPWRKVSQWWRRP